MFNFSYPYHMTHFISALEIVVGTNNFKDTNKTLIKYKANYIKPHENFTRYKRSYDKNDIALIRVSKPIQKNDKINKISLQTGASNNDYTSAVLTGWGRKEVILLKRKLCIKKI